MTVLKAKDLTNQFKENWLEYAKKYLDYGFSVIPIGPNKQPLTGWKEYQTRRPTVEELQDWSRLNNLKGIAVITGKISGVFVLDIDAGGEVKEELPTTPEARTGGGLHYYFSYPKEKEIKNKTNLRLHVDIRGEGGYAILPPTIHENGNEYKWLVDLNTPIANAPDWLLKELQGDGGNSSPLPQIYEGVGEGERNTSATHIIGKLLKGLKPEDWWLIAWPLLKAWNETNRDPLKIEELLSVFKSISTRGIKSQSQSHTLNSSDEVTNEITSFTLEELMDSEFPEVPWLVEDLIPESGISCIAGVPKIGKSYLTLQIAQSISQGTDLFGKFNVKKTGVLIFDKENIRSTIQKRLNQLRVDKKLPIAFSDSPRIRIDDPKHIDIVLNLAKKNNANLIILDSFRRFFDDDENSSMVIAPIQRFFKELNKHGLTILFIHHHGKEQEGFRSRGSKLRGSSDIHAMVDSLISLERISDGYIKVFRSSRQTPPQSPFEIKFPTFKDSDCQFHFIDDIPEEESAFVKAQNDVFNLVHNSSKDLPQVEIIKQLLNKPQQAYKETTIKKACGILVKHQKINLRVQGLINFYSSIKNVSSQGHSINNSDLVTKGS